MLQASHVEYVYNSLNYVVIDEEGYLLDPSDWSRAFTEGRARAADIELSARHWQLIEIKGVRAQFFLILERTVL